MQILATLGRVLLRVVVVVLVVTFVTFGLLKFLPGDPIATLRPVSTEQQREQMREELGLDDPFIVQYGNWLRDFFTGDFGRYYDSGESVNAKLKKSLPVSLQLIVYSIVLALLIAIPLGVLTAYKAGTRFDRSTSAIAFGFIALPNFVLGLILVTYLGAQWKVLPTQGYVEFGADPAEHFRHMLLPVVALAAAQVAVYMRLLRSDMIATLQESFVTTAKAKGVSPARVLVRHALRPSSLTLLTVIGLYMGTLIGGAVVIEVIFGLPGMGRNIYEAILTSQYVALQSFVAIIAVGYVLINAFIDILYTILDPRIRRA